MSDARAVEGNMALVMPAVVIAGRRCCWSGWPARASSKGWLS